MARFFIDRPVFAWVISILIMGLGLLSILTLPVRIWWSVVSAVFQLAWAGIKWVFDKIVGFVGFDRSRDPKTRPTTGEIWAIYAAPSHWSQGVGVALWDAARDGLSEEGCTTVTAWVPLRNERALRFHELAGFKREMSTAKTSVVGSVKIEEVRLQRPLN